MNWRDMILSIAVWLRGLAAAAIGGAATSVSMMVVDPEKFNFQAGLTSMGKVAAISGLINVAFYLKSAPVPAVPPKLELPQAKP